MTKDIEKTLSKQNADKEISSFYKTEKEKNEERAINKYWEGEKQDREFKERTTQDIYKFVCYWCVCVLIIITGQKWIGIDKWPLSVLIGSTTVGVFTCFTTIANGIFKR